MAVFRRREQRNGIQVCIVGKLATAVHRSDSEDGLTLLFLMMMMLLCALYNIFGFATTKMKRGYSSLHAFEEGD